MAASNSVLNEYYSQTKGLNLMFDSDDFWLGAWLGSMFGEGKGGGGGIPCCNGTCANFACCVGCMGCLACFTGNLATWFSGVTDTACGTCTYCTNCCNVGPGYDVGEIGGDQCCDGLCNIFCF